MSNSEKKMQDNSEREIDMGVFLTALARFFQSIGRAIKLFFIKLFEAVIFLLLFIKQKIVWITAGGVIGLLLGIFNYFNDGVSYYSEIIVKPNFESNRFLYQKIDNLNSLVRQKRVESLGQLFDIDYKTAGQLKRFNIKPVTDPLQTAALYKSIYLDYKRYGAIAADTMWTRTVNYDDFKKMLTDYDYPLHIIRVESDNPTVFSKVQQGIINSINENPAFIYARQMNAKLIDEENRLITSSIESMDSLRHAYTKRIESQISKGAAEPTNVFLGQTSARNPEIELYDKMLLFKDELITNMRKKIEEKDVVQVYSDLATTGNSMPRFRKYFGDNAWKGCLIAFAIVLIIELFRYLGEIEKKKLELQ